MRCSDCVVVQPEDNFTHDRKACKNCQQKEYMEMPDQFTCTECKEIKEKKKFGLRQRRLYNENILQCQECLSKKKLLSKEMDDEEDYTCMECHETKNTSEFGPLQKKFPIDNRRCHDCAEKMRSSTIVCNTC